MSATDLARGSGRWIRVGLLVLAVVPVAAGATRLVELAGGPPVLPVNPRIAAAPVVAIIHITSGSLYLLAGILQFSAAFRRRWPKRHVRVGRVLAVVGLAVAGSALWMTLFYPREAGTGSLHYVFRLAFGVGMAACLVLGVAAVQRGNVEGHRAWMMRAYALAAGAGTQVFTQGFTEGIVGDGEVVQRPGSGAMARPDRALPARYVFRIEGHLDAHWSAWLDDLEVTQRDDGTTTLAGVVQDQAQLHGLQAKIRDLGVTLVQLDVVEEPDSG
jgi:uncharacterized membrane protein